MTPAIYLDHAATTPPLPAVVELCARVQRELPGNPSSHHELGRAARKQLDDAREFLRGTLSAAQVVMTGGGTEADQLGVLGAAQIRSPGRVLAGAADHPAVLAQGPLLERFGMRLSKLPVGPDGDLEPETLFEALGQDVRVVSLLHGHNELGTLLRLAELVGLVRRVSPNAHVHVDLVQSYGKIPFDLDAMDVDSVAVSGHKLHAPRGVGFLALSSKARIAALQPGGGQEGGLRGGTENVAGAAALALAAEAAHANLAASARQMTELGTRFETQLRAALTEVTRLGHPERRLPHIVLLRLAGVVGQTLQERCSARGVFFSTGAACHDEHQTTSHVHEAIGLHRREGREVVRVSLARTTTAAEIDAAAAVVIAEANVLLRQAPRRETAR